MKTVRSMLSCLAACALLLGGCATPEPTATGPVLPPMRPGTIARLLVDGPNAYINRSPVQTGSYVVDGDEVSTGPGTSAMLILNEGGFVQLDQNTDPIIRHGTCLFLSILRGRMVFNHPRCVEFKSTLDISALAQSFVHVMSAEEESRITVIEGQVNTFTPTEATLRQNDEYAVPRAGLVQILRLTRNEAIARAAWTKSYFRRPVVEQNRSRVSPWGVAGAAAAIWFLREMLRDDDPPRPQGPVDGATGRQGPGNNTPDAIPRDATGRPIIK